MKLNYSICVFGNMSVVQLGHTKNVEVIALKAPLLELLRNHH